MDIGTGLALLGSAKLVEKLLGPTAEYVGAGIKAWTEKRVKNLKDIVAVAIKRLGPKLDQEAGVPPKVLRTIINDASYSDDPLAAEYFGGVLASSRTAISRDDRGATFAEQISRLSAYQLRCHYILYHSLKRICDGKPQHLKNATELSRLEILVSMPTFLEAMGFSEDEKQRRDSLIRHALYGLQREDLVAPDWAAPGIQLSNRAIPQGAQVGPSIEFEPTALGLDLFLWAYGLPDLPWTEFASKDKQFEKVAGITLPIDAQVVPDVLPRGRK